MISYKDQDMSKSTLPSRKGSIVQQPIQKIIVGVAGGSAAGKTTLCANIYRQMAFDRNFKVEIISLDSFYKTIDKTQVNVAQYNFDHPNALDFDMAYKTLKNLIQSNEKVQIPQYSFIQHARMKQPAFIGPANIIFFEGLMAFYDKRIRDLMTYKIFINCDDDIRLCRRLKRDTAQRGRSVISVLDQYNKFVKNAFRDFILPSIVYADIIIPGFRNNRVSVDFIVQHIKNMARRITFKERAIKTKTFIFGQSEIYDLECNSSYETTTSMESQSFLVFPTSNQHKRQLEFFLNSLLSEIFSVEYFHQIYMNQFVKTLKALLRQLIAFKNLKSDSMEVLSVYNIEEVLSTDCQKYPVKVIFFPMAEVQYSRGILAFIYKYLKKSPTTTFIILNAFCDITVPNLIYRLKLSNVIIINLFVIANDKRFRQIMTNNISATADNFYWFLHSYEIANEGTTSLAKEFNFYRRNESEILTRYQIEIACQNTRKVPKYVDEKLQKVGIIQQHNVYYQQHQNLCGYHALSTLLCLQTAKDITSKLIFVNNYHLLATSLGKVTYEPLERSSLSELLNNKLFQDYKNIAILIYSFKYIQNTDQQIQKLQTLFDELNKDLHTHIYIILGVVDHYVLLRVSKTAIQLYDSNNASLRDIINGTDIQRIAFLGSEKRFDRQFQDYKNRMQNLKEAFQIILSLLNQKKTVYSILVEKRIQDIVGSFNIIKSDEKAIQNWLTSQYPKPVIQQDLFSILNTQKPQISEHHKKLLHFWLNHPLITVLFPESANKFC